jgi:hypothetical protein
VVSSTAIASALFIILGIILIIAAIAFVIMDIVNLHTITYDTLILVVILAIIAAGSIILGLYIGGGRSITLTK